MGERVHSVGGTGWVSGGSPKAIVAIPVQNEVQRIVSCLRALANQTGLRNGDLGIVLFLNNCTDGTLSAAAAFDLPWPTRLVETFYEHASAGWARRNAMEIASSWLAESRDDGVLLTTDADSRVSVDWVAVNLALIDSGADLVAGRISLDRAEAADLPDCLHVRGRLEAEYEALLIEIEARLDPEPGNPWPCHWSKSGATLAVRNSVYLDVGGMPNMATGEDRAFVDAVRAKDFVVRHACNVEVVTSGRLDGRATGGVADTIKLRCEAPDAVCDDRLEPVRALISRALWRRRLRSLHSTGALQATWKWAPALSISPALARQIASSDSFGRAYSAIERTSRKLAFHPVRPRELLREIKWAKRVMWILRVFDKPFDGGPAVPDSQPTQTTLAIDLPPHG